MKLIEVAMEVALPSETLNAVFQRFGHRPTRDTAMSTSVGGIGPLLRERIVAQADEGIEVIGVTLFYDTTWIQSWFDWGQLHLEKREVFSILREFLKNTGLELEIPFFDGKTVKVEVWETAYGKSRVYFLHNPTLTPVVYPSEEDAPSKHPNPAAWAEDIRNRQSWLIGRGALLLAKKLNFCPDIIVQSETPTFFASHRLVKDELQNDPFFANTRYIFNDHTPMEYAHPIWPKRVIDTFKVDTSKYSAPAGAADHGDVDVTRLLIGSADGVFGVAQKHARVMRAMPSLKEYAGKIESITNGVSVPIWQDPKYREAGALTDADLLALKKSKREELLDWVWRHFGLWHTWKQQVADKGVVLWTRRITGYKRIDLLAAICQDASFKKQFLETNLVLLVGGRIHQHDDQAQTMIYNLLDQISVDNQLKERIVFLDNFNVWMAPRLFHGADAVVMLADDGREASATGFMKAQVNGALVIATDDGAIPESVIFQGREKPDQAPNGFEVPYSMGHPQAGSLLKAFRQFQQILQEPPRYAAMIRSALAAEPRVSIQRTARETMQLYSRVIALPTPTAATPVR